MCLRMLREVQIIHDLLDEDRLPFASLLNSKFFDSFFDNFLKNHKF